MLINQLSNIASQFISQHLALFVQTVICHDQLIQLVETVQLNEEIDDGDRRFEQVVQGANA